MRRDSNNNGFRTKWCSSQIFPIPWPETWRGAAFPLSRNADGSARWRLSESTPRPANALAPPIRAAMVSPRAIDAGTISTDHSHSSSGLHMGLQTNLHGGSNATDSLDVPVYQ